MNSSSNQTRSKGHRGNVEEEEDSVFHPSFVMRRTLPVPAGEERPDNHGINGQSGGSHWPDDGTASLADLTTNSTRPDKASWRKAAMTGKSKSSRSSNNNNSHHSHSNRHHHHYEQDEEDEQQDDYDDDHDDFYDQRDNRTQSTAFFPAASRKSYSSNSSNTVPGSGSTRHRRPVPNSHRSSRSRFNHDDFDDSSTGNIAIGRSRYPSTNSVTAGAGHGQFCAGLRQELNFKTLLLCLLAIIMTIKLDLLHQHPHLALLEAMTTLGYNTDTANAITASGTDAINENTTNNLENPMTLPQNTERMTPALLRGAAQEEMDSSPSILQANMNSLQESKQLPIMEIDRQQQQEQQQEHPKKSTTIDAADIVPHENFAVEGSSSSSSIRSNVGKEWSPIQQHPLEQQQPQQQQSLPFSIAEQQQPLQEMVNQQQQPLMNKQQSQLQQSMMGQQEQQPQYQAIIGQEHLQQHQSWINQQQQQQQQQQYTGQQQLQQMQIQQQPVPTHQLHPMALPMQQQMDQSQGLNLSSQQGIGQQQQHPMQQMVQQPQKIMNSQAVIPGMQYGQIDPSLQQQTGPQMQQVLTHQQQLGTPGQLTQDYAQIQQPQQQSFQQQQLPPPVKLMDQQTFYPSGMEGHDSGAQQQVAQEQDSPLLQQPLLSQAVSAVPNAMNSPREYSSGLSQSQSYDQENMKLPLQTQNIQQELVPSLMDQSQQIMENQGMTGEISFSPQAIQLQPDALQNGEQQQQSDSTADQSPYPPVPILKEVPKGYIPPAVPAFERDSLRELSNFKDSWDPYSPTDIPMFWHIPKAGGSSIKDAMGGCHRFVQATEFGVTDGHINDEEVAIVYPKVPGGVDTDRSPFVNIDSTTVEGIQRAKDLGFADAQLADVVVSPFVYETNDLFTPTAKGRLFSVFRHPIDRAISMFYYIQVADWEPSYRPELKEWTLEQYAQSDIVENNWMTRQLSNQLGGDLSDENLQKAMDVVRRKFMVGLMTNIEPTMSRFEKFFRWTFRVNPTNQEACRQRLMSGGSNSNKENKKPSPKEGEPAWDLLAHQNNFDLQLYSYIEQLFEEQEAFVSGLPDNFRNVNATCCKCNPPTYPVEGFTCPQAVKNGR